MPRRVDALEERRLRLVGPGQLERIAEVRTKLIDALLAWLTPDRQLQPELNRFEVRVSEAGDTWIERLRW